MYATLQNVVNHQQVTKVLLPVDAVGAKTDDPPVDAAAGEAVVALKIELAAAGFAAPPKIPEPLAADVDVAAVPKTEPSCKQTC